MLKAENFVEKLAKKMDHISFKLKRTFIIGQLIVLKAMAQMHCQFMQNQSFMYKQIEIFV